MVFSSEFALFFLFFVLVSLFTCLDHFIGVFDYSVGPCFHLIMDNHEELFWTQNYFSREVLEPNFSIWVLLSVK